ncbi:uncharacterized protein LTHEOB_4155 [Lasiodiplodia theobromae]|uniref:uncharacterized protein n=1 Tax=Lasiodiplodia theobromae TaxID=45133 RepID=UPI0015C2E4F7|nr:uncharacterized protein LTHEOB_4155 [Lasiodiplodia theobromae]KAF4546158.1 hypothetical protein LTHEOB_4155 [Lasiodiplodia theobromae]
MKFRFRNFGHRSEDSGQLKADPEKVLHKRRAQVRKAQRTHRERKEAYTKALEAEVLQLRSNEANLLRETKTLYEEIRRLNDVLRVNGIEPTSTQSHATLKPPELESTVSIETYNTQKQLVIRSPVADPQRKDRALLPRRAASYALHKGQLAGTGVRRIQRIDYHKPWRDTMLPANTGSSPVDPGPISKCMRDQDATNIGVEFILT